MTEVRPHQIWETRPDTHAAWRRVKVVNVSMDAVELQYLDSPTLDIATEGEMRFSNTAGVYGPPLVTNTRRIAGCSDRANYSINGVGPLGKIELPTEAGFLLHLREAVDFVQRLRFRQSRTLAPTHPP
jgi:hypothetical protein